MTDRVAEVVRWRVVPHPLLRHHLIPIDVLVVRRDQCEYWQQASNNLYCEAAWERREYDHVA